MLYYTSLSGKVHLLPLLCSSMPQYAQVASVRHVMRDFVASQFNLGMTKRSVTGIQRITERNNYTILYHTYQGIPHKM